MKMHKKNCLGLDKQAQLSFTAIFFYNWLKSLFNNIFGASYSTIILSCVKSMAAPRGVRTMM